MEKNKTVNSKESVFKVCLIKPPPNSQKGPAQIQAVVPHKAINKLNYKPSTI